MVPRTVTCGASPCPSRAFDAHHGHEIDAEGDAFFIGFKRATDAVAAAAAQRALGAADGVRVRMGIHTTEPHLHSDGYVGVGQPRGKDLRSSPRWQIVLSQATAGIVEDDDLLDVRLRDLGDHLLEGHLPTPAAVPDRGRWSPARVSRRSAPGPPPGRSQHSLPLTSPAGAV